MTTLRLTDDFDLDELPALDTDDDEAELETELDLTDFDASLEAGAEPEADDDASELDVGIAIEEPDNDTAGDERGEVVLDIAELLAIADDAVDDSGDETGPADLDPGTGVEELPEAALGDEEGEDAFDDWGLAPELPAIDADEAGDFDDEPTAWAPALETAWDEPPPPAAPRPWTLTPLVEGERVDALLVEQGLVVAAGASIRCLGKQVRRIAPAGRVTSAALVGGRLLYFTLSGQLFGDDLGGADARRLDDWRHAAASRASDAVALELGSPAAEPGVVLARTSTGRLLRSTDRGASFGAEDLHARVIALDARAAPALALVETGSGRSLLVSSDAGSSWRAQPLDDAGRSIAGGSAPRVAARAEVVAIADPERGVAVSGDGGQSFVRIAGTASATALAIGEPADVAFVALQRGAEGSASVARIELGTGHGETIAEFAGDGEETDVSALAWDSVGRRLLVAGSFGLVALEPPSSAE